MATINLKNEGGMVVARLSTSDFDVIVPVNHPQNLIHYYDTGAIAGKISIQVGEVSFLANSLSEVIFGTAPATDKADFLAKIATVFPDTNSGSGGTGATTLDGLPDGTTRFAMTTAQKDFLNALMGVDNP